MGKKYLIDTNIAIYLLDGSLPPFAIGFLEKVIDKEYFISIISKMELLGFDFSDPIKDMVAINFVNEGHLVHLDNEVAEKTIILRKAMKLKLPDAIIAATALTQNMTLVSRNDKDFAKIPDLEYVNPFNLTY